MTQREGRILRQGNTNSKVYIYRYITEGSFDAYSWQLLETKQRFISELLSGSLTERSGTDIADTVLDYAEVKALAVGNPLVKQRVEAANELTRYMALQSKLVESRIRLEKELLEMPGQIHNQMRQGDYDSEQFNIACDIVVNSNILLSNNMNRNSIKLRKYGESMHIAPDGKEGYEYTAEQIYAMLPPMPKGKTPKPSLGASWDDHTRWSGSSEENNGGFGGENEYLREQWEKWLIDVCEVISIRDSTKSFGGGPVLAQRILKQIRKGQIDWREILNNFVQEEITDYSFTPPDRRFDDSPFFLPDYNEKEESIGNIWFVIDTSGSISDDAIKAAYSEICSAIDQFNGKLSGILSFTESYVTDPVPFSSVDELMSIKPVGGGGNDFSDIFRYMKNHMLNELPSQIIIITDGYDSFPPEEAAMEIPVLWLLNNEEVNPPWGKIARIVV